MVLLKAMRALAWCLLAAFSVPAFSAPSLVLDTAPTKVELLPYLDMLEDPGHQFGEADLGDGLFDARFEPLFRGAANYGFSRSDWWVRVRVKNADSDHQNVTLKLDYPLLDFVDVWVRSEGRTVRAWQTGNRMPFSTRAIEHRDFLFPLALAAGEEQAVYLRIRTEGPVNIGLSLFGEKTMMSTVEREYLTFGAYFGGFLLLAFCLLLLYLVDRQVAFLYYLIYIVTYGSYMLAFNGFAFQYIWPNAPDLGQTARPVLLGLSIIFLLQFSRALLGIRALAPKLYRVVTGLQGVLVLAILLLPVLGYGRLVEAFALMLLVALGLVVTMGVVAHREGEQAARYYLLAWSVFLFGVLLYLLKIFGLLPHNFVTHYGFQVGSFFELIFLTLALGVRVKELRGTAGMN